VPWYDVRLASPASLEAGDDVRGPGGDAAGILTAPMPGTVVKVSVSEHDRVHAHQALMVLEAMKMEHVLESPQAGVVIAIHHHDGDLVRGGEPLIEIADDDGSKI
jgi:biotin carboxyl carrier protein